MRFPVGPTGSKQEFEQYWYDAQPFGAQTSYGYHEGADINIKTGGDTDLGQEVKAIANGRLIYYHYATHPTTGFGRHNVYRIEGAWGTRWVHCCHLMDTDFLRTVSDVSEGQIIGRVGKSGTALAHLHFAIYKVDPVAFGIDNIANTQTELNQYWENPISFINTWIGVVPTPPTPQPDIRLQLLDEYGITNETETRIARDRYRSYPTLQAEKDNLENKYNSLRTKVADALANH